MFAEVFSEVPDYFSILSDCMMSKELLYSKLLAV